MEKVRENVHSILRSIIGRRLWLFSGLFVLLLLALLSLLLLPTGQAHAAPVQQCPVIATSGGAHGGSGQVVVQGGTGQEGGCTISTGGQVTGGQKTICTAKNVEGRKPVINCTAGATCQVEGGKGQRARVICEAHRQHP